MDNNFWEKAEGWIGGIILAGFGWLLSRRQKKAETTKADAEARKITSEQKKIDSGELDICRAKLSEQFEQMQVLKGQQHEQKKEIERLTRKLNVFQTLESAIKNKKL